MVECFLKEVWPQEFRRSWRDLENASSVKCSSVVQVSYHSLTEWLCASDQACLVLGASLLLRAMYFLQPCENSSSPWAEICLPGTFTHQSCFCPTPETTQYAAHPSSSWQLFRCIWRPPSCHQASLLAEYVHCFSTVLWDVISSSHTICSLKSRQSPPSCPLPTDFIETCYIGIGCPLGVHSLVMERQH